MLFASSGPGKPDGYLNAQVNLKYAILDCPGQISVAFQVIPGSVQAYQTYWHDGGDFPSSLAPVPATPHVQFAARVLYRSKTIAQMKFFGAAAITPNSPLGCAGGINIGRFPNFLPAGYGNKEKEEMFKNIEVWIDTSPLTLQNPAIHDTVKRQRNDKKAAEAKAAEQQAKKEAEERARLKAQQEAQTRAVLNKTTQNKDLQAAQPTQRADGSLDFWGSGPAGRGEVGSGHREGHGHGAGRPPTAVEIAAERKVQETRELRAWQHAERRRQEHETRRAIEQTERAGQAMASSINTQRDTRATGQRVENLLSMEGQVDSLAELDGEMARRMEAVDRELWALRDRQRAAVNLQTNLRFGGGTQVEQSAGQLTNLLVNMAQEQQRQAAAEEAQERLAAERERIEREIVSKGRKLLVENFTDGKMPLSSTKLHSDVVYFFAFRTLQPTEMTPRYGALLTTKPFAVARRGDGTWPFRQRLDGELQNVLKAPHTLVGFYTSEEQANKAFGMMQRVAEQSGLKVAVADFKPSFARSTAAGSTGQASSPAPDFWKTGSAPAAATKTQGGTSAPDFWNKGTAPAANTKTDSGAAAPDFWKK